MYIVSLPDIPEPVCNDENENDNNVVLYVVVTATAAIILTAIVAGVIMAIILYFTMKKYKNSGRITSKNDYYAKNSFSPNNDNGSMEMKVKT